MKKIRLISMLFLMIFGLGAFPGNANTLQNEPVVGQKLLIKSPYTSTYKAVNFPKLNFLVKTGGLPNYKAAYNTLVEITEVEQNNKGEYIIRVAKPDGSEILTDVKSLRANYSRAIQLGELQKA